MGGNYIIGGGISGLIFAYYNPEFTLITDSLGGLLSDEKIFGNMILWDTPETRDLLSDLEFEIEEVKERIYYFFNGKIYDEAPEVLRREYLLKRMGALSSYIDFKDLALSTDEANYMDGLRIDFNELIGRLIKEIQRRKQLKIGKVIKLDDDTISFEDEETRDGPECKGCFYNQLISTIPAFIFWKLWEGEKCKEGCEPEEFLYIPTTYFSMEKPKGIISRKVFEPGHLPLDFRYSIYFLDDSAYHRMTRSSGDYYSVNFSGDVSLKDGAKILLIEPKDLHRRVERIGNFLPHKGNIPPNNILFLGRHAQWDYKVKVQDIVRVSRFSKFMLEEIRNRQTRFNKNFIEFNKLSFEKKQKLTEKWILYVMSELDELLKETNWKLHKPMKEIKREKIVEEWVDIFKFVLGIADIWGITNTEVYKAFMDKSSKVENLWQKNKEGVENDTTRISR